MVVQFWAAPMSKYLHCCITLYIHPNTIDVFRATVGNKYHSPTSLLQKGNTFLVKRSTCTKRAEYRKRWRQKDELSKGGYKYWGQQILKKEVLFGKKLRQINSLAKPCNMWRWQSNNPSLVNLKLHSRGSHFRNMRKLVLCLNMAASKGQVWMSLSSLFWDLAFQNQANSMVGFYIEDNHFVTNIQSLINMAVECLLVVLRALYLLLLFAPSIVISIFAAESNIHIRSFWLGLLLKTIEHSGPTFIKWGQWAAIRPDIFPSDVCRELSKLHFEAPAHSLVETRKIVNKAFRLPIEEIFEKFSDKPVASGSIAQVYHAVLKQEMSPVGKPITVAVKVRHPHVRKMVQRDFTIIKCLAKASTLMPGLKHLQLDKSVHHFATFMTKQVDLTLEASHLTRFKHNFWRWKNVIFPEPIYPFVHPEVLVETFEEGQSIVKYACEGPQSQIKSHLAEVGTRLFLKMLLVDNFVHGDLHPGNVFVRLDGVLPQIVLLDAGMAIELSERNRLILLELFKAATIQDGKTVAKCTLEFSREQSCPDTDQFVRDVDEKFKSYLNVRGSAKNTGECMTALFDEVRRHRVNIDGDICTVMVTSLIHEGWQRKLDPNLDILVILGKQLEKKEYSESFNYFMRGVVAL